MNSKFVRLFLLMLLQVVGFSAAAQQIAVVTGSNTTVHQTLAEAIQNADNGSVIYLPGGGFNMSDDVKITKRVTIIGIGHKANSDNADGATMISGNLWFNSGSDGSALLGCYVKGDVNIAEDGPVNNVTIKLCNIGSVRVKNSAVTGTFINQNYIRNGSYFAQSSATITNNILYTLLDLNASKITHNFIMGGRPWSGTNTTIDISNSIVTNNAFCGGYFSFNDSGCQTSQNFYQYGQYYGNEPIKFEGFITQHPIFINISNGAINSANNYHFKDEYKQYESQVGIYAGTGFSDGALPPVPYIVAKNIAEQTDAAGKLRIKLRVNAGE